MKFSWHAQVGRPVIVAHRGSSAIAPENTLSAFSQAILDRADAAELDVRATKDGEIVAIHDSHLSRTTDGHGRVENCLFSDLKKLDAGGWFGRKFASERVPALTEVLELIGGRIGINIEVKSRPGAFAGAGFIEKLVGILREYRNRESVLVSSFNTEIIKSIKKIEPGIVTGLIYGQGAGFTREYTGADFLICSKRFLRRKTVAKEHKLGHRIGVYVVNDSRTFLRLSKWGVDSVYSDNPAYLKEITVCT